MEADRKMEARSEQRSNNTGLLGPKDVVFTEGGLLHTANCIGNRRFHQFLEEKDVLLDNNRDRYNRETTHFVLERVWREWTAEGGRFLEGNPDGKVVKEINDPMDTLKRYTRGLSEERKRLHIRGAALTPSKRSNKKNPPSKNGVRSTPPGSPLSSLPLPVSFTDTSDMETVDTTMPPLHQNSENGALSASAIWDLINRQSSRSSKTVLSLSNLGTADIVHERQKRTGSEVSFRKRTRDSMNEDLRLIASVSGQCVNSPSSRRKSGKPTSKRAPSHEKEVETLSSASALLATLAEPFPRRRPERAVSNIIKKMYGSFRMESYGMISTTSQFHETSNHIMSRVHLETKSFPQKT
jgi:hypothetical protein